MTAVNGKPVSVRTFKLSNAMKQSLAVGNSNVVAAAVTAFQNGSSSLDMDKQNGGHMVKNGGLISGNPHLSPSAFAIVSGNGVNPNVVSSPNGCNSPQVVFKTPLAPKSSPVSTVLSPGANNHHQFYIVNGNDVSPVHQAVATPPKQLIKAKRISVSPVLANEAIAATSKKRTPNGKAVEASLPVSSKSKVAQSPKSRQPSNRSRNNSIDSNYDSLQSPYSGGLDSGHNLSTSSSGPSSPSSTEANGRKSARYETSLGQLTRKFISLLEKSPNGSINLNEASNILQVQKRRIYDITNVLEGVGLLNKTFKNNIEWRGGLFEYCTSGKSPLSQESRQAKKQYKNRKPPPLSLLFSEDSNSMDSNRSYDSSQREQLQKELNQLENDENRLDQFLEMVNLDIHNMKSTMSPSLYVTYLDLRRVPEFSKQTVIGIRPPSDTTLEVPDPSEVSLTCSSRIITNYLFYRICKSD